MVANIQRHESAMFVKTQKFFLDGFLKSFEVKADDPLMAPVLDFLAMKKTNDVIDSFNLIVDGVLEQVRIGFLDADEGKLVIQEIAETLEIKV